MGIDEYAAVAGPSGPWLDSAGDWRGISPLLSDGFPGPRYTIRTVLFFNDWFESSDQNDAIAQRLKATPMRQEGNRAADPDALDCRAPRKTANKAAKETYVLNLVVAATRFSLSLNR